MEKTHHTVNTSTTVYIMNSLW